MKNKKGFTLVELIVAVVIISLVLSLVSSFVWLSFKISTRSKKIALRYAGIRNVLEIIGDQLKSASKFDYGDEPNFILDSERKYISFWVTIPAEDVLSISPYHLCRMTYFIKKEKDEPILYKRVEEPFTKNSKESPVYKGEFKFYVLIYDKERKNILEEESYSEEEPPLGVKVKWIKDGTEIERIFYLPYGKQI